MNIPYQIDFYDNLVQDSARDAVYQQSRGYNVGWLDQGRIVSPGPGRLIVYDGRCLHATSQAGTGLDNPSVKLAFRARRINTK